MTGFLAELRRRHMYRIGGLYVVVAWGITQVIDVLSQIYALPDWIAQPILAVLVLGFPVTLLFAWTIIGTAKSGETPAELKKATVTDWALIATFIAVLCFMGYQQFAPNDATVVDAMVATAADEIIEDVADRLPNSVAVLPFENISPEPDDAYFAVGIHDELISKLSRLRNLSVIGRQSVLQYADSDKTIPEIADELNVEMVMSGTVRRAGDAVLVSAQLVDGETNLQVWDDQYDGEMADIFGIQAEIAMNIANSLQASFTVAEQQLIEAIPTTSTEAYDAYLRAVTLFRDGSFGGGAGVNIRRAARDYLEQALQLDPEFAAAHALMASAYEYTKIADPVPAGEWQSFRDEMDRLALEHADRALAIDSGVGLAHAVRGWIHFENARMTLASEEAEIALELSPRDLETLALNRHLAVLRGDFDAAIEFDELRVASDPNHAQLYSDFGTTLRLAGRDQEAVEQLEKSLALDPLDGGTLRILAATQIALGDYGAALDALRRIEINGVGFYNSVWLAWGYGVLGRRDDARRISNQFFALAEGQYQDPGILVFINAGVGNYEEALTQFRIAVENPRLVQRIPWPHLLHNVWSDPMLETPEFRELRDRIMTF